MGASTDPVGDRSSNTAETATVLPFDLRGTRYCTHADRVRSVVGVDTSTTDLRGAPDPWYAGEVSYRDERIRVVDLGRIFRPAGTEAPAESQLVVFEALDDEGVRFGWLVDSVDTTTTVSRDDFARTQSSGRYVLGTLNLEGSDVPWLDERAINE